MISRAGAVPRSWFGLAFLAAVVALIVGVKGQQHRAAPGSALGGPVFAVAADQVEGLLLTRQGMQYRFDRGPDGHWSLSGAVDDYLDPQAMEALVAMLPGVQGGALLPGTEIEDRRYEFNGPEAIRLRLFTQTGPGLSLALGARNPVTGNVYASGVGRTACFPVPGAFRDKLSLLPNTVLSRRLLPPFDRHLVQEIIVSRSGTEHRLVKIDDRWWLHWRGGRDAVDGLPPQVQEYQRLYDDRQRLDATGFWLLADGPAVGQLIYEVSHPAVREILPPRLAASRRQQWQLDPAWRKVVLRGEGLNPDPSAPVRDQFTVALGTPLAKDRVPALRRSNVLVTDLEAIKLLDQGLEALVAQNALNEVARHADHLVVEREGRALLRASRSGTSVTDEGREAWQTTMPRSGASGLDDKERHGLVQDLVVNLNRVAILRVLPPTTDSRVLQDAERVRMTLTWDTAGASRELVLVFGFLDANNLPPGAQNLARTAGGRRAVGLWFPETGKLLQTPDHILVTVRSMVSLLAAGTP